MQKGRQHKVSATIPLRGYLIAYQWISEVNDGSILLLELARVLRVVLNQLRECGEGLPTIKIIIVSRVLYPYVSDVLRPTNRESEVSLYILRWTDQKRAVFPFAKEEGLGVHPRETHVKPAPGRHRELLPWYEGKLLQ